MAIDKSHNKSNKTYYNFPILQYLNLFDQYRFELKTFPNTGKSLATVDTTGEAGFDPLRQMQEIAESFAYNQFPPYIEFANLNVDDMGQLLEYANTKGIPASPNVFYGLDTAANLHEIARRYKMDLSDTCETYGGMTLKTLIKVKAVHRIYPVDLFKEEIRKMRRVLKLKEISEDPKAFGGPPVWVANASGDVDMGVRYNKWEAAREVCSILTDALSDARITLWDGYKPGDKESNPAFLKMYTVKDLKQALYAALYENISIKTKKCADPKCGRLFSVTQEGKIYCEPYCGVKVARRRYYVEVEKPLREKGRVKKHGKKTRKR